MAIPRLIFCSLTFLVLCACSRPPIESKSVEIANPASEYCAKLNGRVEILKHKDGSEYGMCHLPDGTSIEEWQLFRRDHKE